MSLVTVYPYEFYNDEPGAWFPAGAFAKLEVIKGNNKLRQVMSGSWQVDSSQISEGGFYHPPSETKP